MRELRDPRVVIVTRQSPLDALLEQHGTVGQATFFLQTRQQGIERFLQIHATQQQAVAQVQRGLPADRRRTRVDRDELDRFVFEPDDVIVAVGQDGLVANVAKYLDGQPVIGVNPDRKQVEGVLSTVPPQAAWAGVQWLMGQRKPEFAHETRTMVEARSDDGVVLRGLNEVFVGHKSHQSAIYTLQAPEGAERQSSSGLIISTGTGATGWARSIARQRGLADQLPGPFQPAVAWMVREPWPSVATGCEREFGLLAAGQALRITSEMGDGGTAFADGIEGDRIELGSGRSVSVQVSERTLALLTWQGG